MSVMPAHRNAKEFYPVNVVDHLPVDIDQFCI